MALSVTDFAAAIKAKYPDYAGIDDETLARAIVAKHPEYASQVDFGDNQQPNGGQSPAQQQPAETRQQIAARYRAEGALPGEKADFVEPTLGERVKSGLANAAAGVVDTAGGMLAQPIDYSIDAATAGPARRAAQALRGQPVTPAATPAADLVTRGGTALANTIRNATGVRPNAITDTSDAVSRAAPQVAAAVLPFLHGTPPVEAAAEDIPREAPPTAPAPAPTPAPAPSGQVAPPLTDVYRRTIWQQTPDVPPTQFEPGTGEGAAALQTGKPAGIPSRAQYEQLRATAENPMVPSEFAERARTQADAMQQTLTQYEQLQRTASDPTLPHSVTDAAKRELDALHKQLTTAPAPDDYDFPSIPGVNGGVARPATTDDLSEAGLLPRPGDADYVAPPAATQEDLEHAQQIQQQRQAMRQQLTQPPAGGGVPPTRGPGGLPAGAPPQPPTPPPTAPVSKTNFAKRLYDRVVPQTVDAIERQGPAGAEVANIMRTSDRKADQMFQQFFAPAQQMAKGMSADELTRTRQVLEQWDTMGLGQNPQALQQVAGDPKVAQLAQFMRNGQQLIDAFAGVRLKDYMPMADYFHYLHDPDAASNPMLQTLQQYAGNEAYGLTKQRGPNAIAPEGKDVLRAYLSYGRGSSRFLNQLQEFGVSSRPELDAKLENYAQAMQGQGYDGDLARRFGSRALGGGQTDDPVSSAWAQGIASYEAAAHTAYAPIRHFQQIRNDITAFGAGNTLRGFVDTVGQKFGASPQYAQAVVDSGALVRNSLGAEIGPGRGGVVGALQGYARLKNLPTKAIADNVKAQLTAFAAAHHYDDLIALARGEAVPAADRMTGDFRPTAVVQQQAADILTRSGVDVQKAASGNAAALEEGRRNYIWQAVNDTQGYTSRLGAPAIAQTAWGRVFTTFQRPMLFGTDYALNKVIAPIKQGNLQPLVRYVTGSLLLYGGTETGIAAARGQQPEDNPVLNPEARTLGGVTKFAAEAAAPHGLIPHYSLEGRPGETSDNPAIAFGQQALRAADPMAHAGAAGAAYSDYDAIKQAVQRQSATPLLRLDSHVKAVHDMAPQLLPTDVANIITSQE